MKQLFIFLLSVLLITACTKEKFQEENIQSLTARTLTEDDSTIDECPSCPQLDTSVYFDCDEMQPVGTETWDTASDPAAITYYRPYLYIDFDGDGRRGWPTHWPDAPATGFAAYTGTNKTEIVQRVITLYEQSTTGTNGLWRIGTSRQQYDNTRRARRARIVVTPTDEWYRTGVSGVAHLYSMWWLEEVPCYVFSDRLYNNTKYISDIITHEAGHTIGLGHQKDFRLDCTVEQTYSYGKIMGNPTSHPAPYWFNQTSSCQPQNDTLILNSRQGGNYHL